MEQKEVLIQIYKELIIGLENDYFETDSFVIEMTKRLSEHALKWKKDF